MTTNQEIGTDGSYRYAQKMSTTQIKYAKYSCYCTDEVIECN